MRALLMLCVAVLATACQLSGGPAARPGAVPTDASDGPRLGAPEAGLPSTLDELLDRGLRVAEEWQEEPILAEVEVDLDEQRRWTGARLLYVAADADRFLSLVASGSGFSQERLTLSTLQTQPIPAEGLADVPAFPDTVLEPVALLDAEDAAACNVGPPATVLYVTGAPVAWDGVQWTSPPEWRATVTSEAAGAVLDVASGSGECLSDEPLPTAPPPTEMPTF